MGYDKEQQIGSDPAPEAGQTLRIARFLAAAGIASRRQCERLLSEQRVEVNGRTITDPACRVDPGADQVRFDGRIVSLARPLYLLLYKPAGVTCSSQDRHAEKLIVDLLPAQFGRLFTVGRLDRDSEGLIICTNDGAFAQRVAHPRYGLEKCYRVFVRGRITGPALTRLRTGVVWEGEKLCPEQVRRVAIHSGKEMITELEFVLREGKKRELRRLCECINAEVVRLRRIRIGPVSDSRLEAGEWRFLQAREIAALQSDPDNRAGRKREK